MFYNEAQFAQTSIIGRWRHRLTSASADRTSRILWNGAVAQLGERVVRNDEVRGSIPLGSTSSFPTPSGNENAARRRRLLCLLCWVSPLEATPQREAKEDLILAAAL